MRVKAPARCCGSVQVRADRLLLQLVVDDHGRVDRDQSRYRFDCPVCGELIDNRVTEQVVDLLAQAGVTPTTPGAPAGHPERPPAGPALTGDDLASFRDLLADPAWQPPPG